MEPFRVAGEESPEELSEWGLSGAYAAAFKGYINGGGEAALEQAYQIGRRAIDRGLGVLDLAAIHEAVLETSLRRTCTPETCAQLTKAAEDFFAETLAPYEMVQQGYRQANNELRELNRTLERRVEARTRQLREKDRAVRQAYVDVLSAVTGGKLIILTADELAASLGRPLTGPYKVNDFHEVANARTVLKKALVRDFPGLADLGGLVLAADEALTNAVKHAGGGDYRVYGKRQSAQVLIADSGSGIDFKILPKATLTAGFSTKRTLGVGFSVMLDFCHRVLLATGADGTTIVLEMKARRVEVDGQNNN